MVGVPCDSLTAPVSSAHKAMREPGATVTNTLATLKAPPLTSIPHLTSLGVRPGEWVRYTAMVQDIWDPELFVAKSPDGQSGLLVENAAASSHENVVLAERLPVYLVSIPGETPWAHRARYGNSFSPVAMPTSGATVAQSRLKRRRDSGEMTEMGEVSSASNDSDSTIAAVAAMGPPLLPNRLSASDKRSKPSDGGFERASSAPTTVPLGLNTPVPHQSAASAVIAKFYGMTGDRTSSLILNTVIEVVGVLQEGMEVDPMPQNAFAAELIAHNPQNVMRLHVVQWRVTPAWHLNPLIAHLGQNGIRSALTEVRNIVSDIRRSLIEYFQGVLLGDALAAEYLVMALLSKPLRRGEQLVGKLSLNLVLPSNHDNQATEALRMALHSICSSVVTIDVNIASLNSREVYARKDYEVNRLRAGCLQLAEGSCLLLNETALSHGRLAERGVKNMRALKAVSNQGVALVDFKYYESEVDVQYSTVLLSKGGKSIVGGDVVIRVIENPPGCVTLQNWEARWLARDVIEKLRMALTLLLEDGRFDISDQISEEVSQTYVEARRNGGAKDGQESLQRWLAVARASARTFGESQLSSERWKYAMELERLRECRVGTDRNK